MTQVALHATPSGRDVILEQIRLVFFALRREAMIVALFLVGASILMALSVARGDLSTWFDSDDWSPVALISFFLPFAVWRGERRFGPSIFWSLPVDRRQLALARVFAGWVWLLAALGTVVIWHRTLAFTSRVEHPQGMPLISFVGATAMYLAGSALLLGLRHPLRWLFGTAVVVFMLGNLNEMLGFNADGQSRMFASIGVLRWLIYGPYGIDTLLSSRSFTSAIERSVPLICFVWLAITFAALWAAVSRHSDRRRH
jgi:hypothetical protein